MFPRQVSAPTSRWRHATAVLRQLQWVWQLRWTGGYFLMVGKKRGAAR